MSAKPSNRFIPQPFYSWSSCVLLLFSIFISSLSIEAQNFSDSELPFINLTPSSLYFEDEGNDMGPDQVMARLSEFQRCENDVYNFGLTDASLWIYIDLESLDRSLTQLAILEPRLEDVSIYTKSENGWELIFKGGQNYPFDQREMDLASFLIDLNGHLEKSNFLLLRIYNQTKRNLPIFLSNHSGSLLYYSHRNLVNGLYFGLLFIMILYNSFVFISVRDKNYLYYIIFLLLIALAQGYMMGLTQQYIFPNNNFLMIQGSSIFAPMAGIAATLFIMHILSTRREMKYLHWTLILVVSVYSMAIVLSLFRQAEIAYSFMQAGNLMGSGFVLVCAILSTLRGNITARYILAGWTIMIFSIIAYVFTELGIVEFNYKLSPHLVQIGSSFEILLFSFALADRINRYREERLLAISDKEQLLRSSVDTDKENSRKFAELELSALRGQMNPHFVFNALGAIQYYIHTHDVELADDYLTKFALLMRKYLESSRQKMISVRGEMELIKLYTDLETLRFESKFKCTISSDPELDLEDEMIPSMLIQPFIENAIKHGLNDRMDKLGRLIIHFSPIKNGVKVRIDDNGVGFEKGLANRSPNHQSRGMQIIKEKVNTLEESGLAKVKIQYETLDIENKEFPGTVVILTIVDLMTDEYV